MYADNIFTFTTACPVSCSIVVHESRATLESFNKSFKILVMTTFEFSMCCVMCVLTSLAVRLENSLSVIEFCNSVTTCEHNSSRSILEMLSMM